MQASAVLPDAVESYATVRVVWFGASASANPSGTELSTNGQSDIAGLSWSKDTESPAGVMSVLLFPRQDYLDIIQPDDVLVVFGKADKTSQEKLISMVSVDTVVETKSVTGSGATITRISIQARDLGKVLMETPTVYDPAFGGLTTQTFFTLFTTAMTQRGSNIGGPSVVVQSLIAAFYSLTQNFVTRAIGATLTGNGALSETPLKPFLFPGSLTNRQAGGVSLGTEIVPESQTTGISLMAFIDTESFVQTPMVGDAIQLLSELSILQNASNLWQLCEMYANRMVNEFFIDVRDLVPNFSDAVTIAALNAQNFLIANNSARVGNDTKLLDTLSTSMSIDAQAAQDFQQVSNNQPTQSVICVVHRQLPYDTQMFYALPTTLVYSTECKSANYGRSSREVQNYIRMRFPGIVEGMNQDYYYGTIINRDSISAHGLRRYEGETIYGANLQSNATTPEIDSVYSYFTSLIAAWNAWNEFLLSGSITMRFRPDIRVGTRLTYCSARANGTLRVIDFYVQHVMHSWSPNANQSTTTVDVIRGVERSDATQVPQEYEGHLYWSYQGASLNPNPYEVVVSDNIIGVLPQGPTPPPVQGTND